MCDCERFAQIAQDKCSTVSESLRLLKTARERFAQVAHDNWANEQFAKKTLAKKIWNLIFNMFYIGFFIKKMSNSLIPSFLVSDHLFFHKKLAIRSENRWANSQPCLCLTVQIDINIHSYEGFASFNTFLCPVGGHGCKPLNNYFPNVMSLSGLFGLQIFCTSEASKPYLW